MKQGKYAAPVKRRRRRNTLKPVLISMALVLLLGCVTGGTLAWLTSTPDPVTNTFTVGKVAIDLDESTTVYKMVPGCAINKDPKVTVTAGSEPCYLFVKIEEGGNINQYIAYNVNSNWTPLKNAPGMSGVAGVENVWYKVINPVPDAGAEYPILASGSLEQGGVTYNWTNNQVLVKPTVTKAMMDAAESNNPTLTFQAAAVQYYKSNDVAFEVGEAYAQAWPSTTP